MSGAQDRWSGAWRGRPELQEAAATEVARLGWLYVSRLVQQRRPDDLVDFLARLGQRDLAYLRALRFVGSTEVEALLATGASLLRRLPQSTRPARTIAREVRGRIDWAATTQEQLARGSDPTIFVVTMADRHADVPENRVLGYVLRRISQAAQAVGVRSEVAGRGLEAERLLSNSALSRVRIPAELSGMDRQALRVSRIPEFRGEVASALAVHDSLFSEDLDGLKAALGERVWLPPEADKLFELWVLFALAQSLERAGWNVSRVRLIGADGSSAPTFVMRKATAEIRLSYQALPSQLLRESIYRSLLDAYDIDGSARRPDILVSAPGGLAATLHLLIEAKLTEDRDYIVDSVYKVLGYLADFEKPLAPSPAPRGVLVVWGGVGPPPATTCPHPMLVLDHAALYAGVLVPLIEALSVAALRSLEAT